MRSDYQPTKNNSNWIPREYYKQTVWFIKSYDQMKQEHDDILEEGKSLSDLDGMPHGSGISDETAQKAIRAERLFNDITIINQALLLIPKDYRKSVFEWVKDDIKPPAYLSRRMFRYYRGTFIRAVAIAKEII